jgi:hypothetical protein
MEQDGFQGTASLMLEEARTWEEKCLDNNSNITPWQFGFTHAF